MTTQPLKPLPASLGEIFRHQVNISLLWLKSQSVTLLLGSGLLGIFIILLATIQFVTPDLAGNDGYYHIKLAQVMRQQGLRPPFPWLPLTVLNSEAYVDYHFLYHILLIPFTYGDLRAGAKWASVVLPAFTFLSGWILLRGQRVPYAALWSLGFFAVSAAFLYRMSMPRAQSVSLMFLLLSLHVVLSKRYRWLLPLAFLYVWLYKVFPLMLVLIGAYIAARWLLEGKFDLTPLLYSSLGIILGLLINPYFPNNFLFIPYELLPKLTDATVIGVGNEWYPYKTWTLVENSGLALFVFVAGAFALGLREKRMDIPTATMFFVTVLFGFMLFKSRRFVEYYPAFALIFCVFAWTPLLKAWVKAKTWVALLLPIVMSAGLILAITWNAQGAQESLRKSKPYQRYAEASAWLQENTPAGSRIFQTDWDDFTRLYFYNTHNTYTAGLDPANMQLYDAELYEVWVDITKGRVEAPAQIIAETFEAGYVLTDLNHKGFLREAKADPDLEEVYRDEYAAIFRVNQKFVEKK